MPHLYAIILFTGQSNGIVEFRIPADSKIKIFPLKFDLQPFPEVGAKQMVRISYDPKETGVRAETIQVFVSGGSSKYGTIDVVAEVVHPKLTLLGANREGILDSVDFGSIFFGESKTITGILVNNGPKSMSYSVSYADEDQKGSILQSQIQIQTNDAESLVKSLSIAPKENTIKPYSEVTVNIIFTPKAEKQIYGFEKQFIQDVKEAKLIYRKVFIDCPEIDQRIFLTLQGAANVPLVTVSPAVMRFGVCPVYDRRDIKVR